MKRLLNHPFRILVAAAMCLTLVPVQALAPVAAYAYANGLCICGVIHTNMVGHMSPNYKGWDEPNSIAINEDVGVYATLNKVSSPGIYALTQDQTFNSTLEPYWSVPAGETVLFTHGYDITFEYSSSKVYGARYLAGIYVDSSSTLTISGYTSNSSQTTQITGNTHASVESTNVGTKDYCGIVVGGGGVLNLYGVNISMTGSDMSGILVLPGGTVNVYPGVYGGYPTTTLIPTTISGNTKYGIENRGGTVNMYGGTITGNAKDGVYVQDYVVFREGGGYNTDGVVNMYGGTISGNGGSGVDLAYWYDGTGTSSYGSSILNMYGGTITGNGTSTGTGGGVYVKGSRAKMNLHGENVSSSIASGSVGLKPVTITGNKGSTGPNVYVNNTSANDPRISVTSGTYSALREDSKIGIVIGRCASGATDEDWVTSDTPTSAEFFTSDLDGFGISTKSGMVTQVRKTDAPMKVKDITVEYTGSAIDASLVDDDTGIDGTWSWKGTAPKNAGAYENLWVVFTPSDTGRYNGAVEKAVDVIVTPKPVTVSITAGGGTYNGTITPATATLSGVAEGDSVPVTLTYTGTANDGASYNSTTAPTKAGTYTVTASIANTNYELTGETTAEFAVAKQVRTAPNVTASDETVYGKGDGAIAGLTTDMEVSADGGNTYQAVTDVNAAYDPGTYIVRYVDYAEDANREEAPTTEVTIASGRKLSVSVPAEQTGYSLTAYPTQLDWSGSSALLFTLAPGYSKTDDFKVLINGTTDITSEIEAHGAYALNDVQEDVVVTVAGVADITAPDVELSMRGATWKDFVNAISFGLFFKDIEPVVTASDLGSGIASVGYLLSDAAIANEADAKATTGWTSLTLDEDGKANIPVSNLGKKYLYVRVADNAGNVAVVSPDCGVVVYTDSVADTLEIAYTKATAANVTANVALNGNTVASIVNSTTPLSSGDYSVAADGTITFMASYLDTLAEGDYTLTLTYNPQGETYAECRGADGIANINDAPATTAIALKVSKQTGAVSITGEIGKTYDGTAVAVSSSDYTTNNSEGTVTVEYKVQGAVDGTYTSTAPKDAGSYTMRVTVQGNGSYTEVSDTKDFTISRKEVSIIGATVAKSKVYDGTTSAEIKSTGTLSANYDGDNLAIERGLAAYEDKNVGNDKAVSFSSFALVGSAAGNYRLAGQPENTEADITPKPLTVSIEAGGGTYNGTITPTTATLSGVVEGDSVPLTLTYTGAANDGTAYNSTTAPTKAGTYTVTASISNPNHMLTGQISAEFVVARQARLAPSVTTTDETISGKGDGSIIGLTTDMEVSADGGTSYQTVTDVNAAYGPGTYIVRYVDYAEDANREEAPTTEVAIATGRKLSVTVPPDQVGYTLTTSASQLDWNGTATLSFDLAQGYTKTDDFKVLINGTADTTRGINADGAYTLNGVQEDVVVTVAGVADVTAPYVDLSTRSAIWSDFMSASDFGLFFKDSIKLSVTAADYGSGIASVEYLLSDVVITSEADAKAATGWTSLTLDENGEASISVSELGKKHLYVRAADNAGNVTVVSPDCGIVVYKDSVADTVAITYTKATADNVTANVALNGNTIASIANGTTPLSSDDYSVAADGTITFMASYLDSLAEGDYTLTLSYNPQGEAYVEYKGEVYVEYEDEVEIYAEYENPDGADCVTNINDAPATTTIALKVIRQTGIVDITGEIGKTYDGTVVTVLPSDYTTNNSAGTVTVEYKVQGADDSTYTSKAPKDVGSYTVRVAVQGNDSYTDASAIKDFTITPKPVTTTVRVRNKIYDGTNYASYDNKPELSGTVKGDDVILVPGAPTFSQTGVGADIPIDFTEFTLSGADAANYILTQPTDITASISACYAEMGTKTGDTAGLSVSYDAIALVKAGDNTDTAWATLILVALITLIAAGASQAMRPRRKGTRR